MDAVTSLVEDGGTAGGSLQSWRQEEEEEEEEGETFRERKGEMVQPPHEVVEWLFVVEMVMNKTVVGVVMGEGHGGERMKR
jgi:hypothetical protein